MRARLALAIVVTFLLVMGIARAASAQQVAPFLPTTQPSAQPRSEASAAESGLQATGVSLTRIQGLLGEQPPAFAGPTVTVVDARIRVAYQIKVEGRMPYTFSPIGDFNIDKKSAVAYGGMTHGEFMHVVAPPWRKW